ncbi:MAG: glycosyltransferase [Alphaproteobacteria bacterium]|nr:glycosyltransferase [Alphaproteobacteria bacterium]
MRIVVIGLSLSSSWGNGHATTWRALLKGLGRIGHEVRFLEQDVPYYAAHRDLPQPDFARLDLYASLDDLRRRFAGVVRSADAVIVGSYVQSGIEVIDWVAETGSGLLAFYDIDTPVTLARLARGDCAYIAARQIPSLDLYLSFTGGPTLRVIERELGARAARALYCSVDIERYRPPRVRDSRWRLGYMGTYSPDRQGAVEALLLETARRHSGDAFVLAGPSYPEPMDRPANLLHLPHLPPSDHPAFYGAQDFTLNLTRADMRKAGWSPSVRLFEAAACGTPIISDRWAGIGTLFPEGEAILVADGPGDMDRFLALSPEERSLIGSAAHEIVRERHTGERRAGELERHLAGARRRLPESLEATP